MAAIERGVDLVVGYGGDGTQHELANAVIGTTMPMAMLPGGTGNGFRTRTWLSRKSCALPSSCSARVAGCGRSTSGALANSISFSVCMPASNLKNRPRASRRIASACWRMRFRCQNSSPRESTHFRITVDGQVIEAEGVKLYVVNSGMMGKGVRIAHEFSIDDGYLDVFVLGRDALSIMAAETRLLKMKESPLSRLKCWRGRSIQVEADPAKTIWTDGELHGTTPVTVEVVPGALSVLAPVAK